MVQQRHPQYDVAMSGVSTVRVTIAIAAVIVTAFVLLTRPPDPTPSAPDATRAPPGGAAPAPAPPQPDTSPGLRCIRGGTTREDVRAIMGEPDSVAFGDWVYGRSSITFGYGVVLDYANAGGNLVVCP
jgi:hypothetical protein